MIHEQTMRGCGLVTRHNLSIGCPPPLKSCSCYSANYLERHSLRRLKNLLGALPFVDYKPLSSTWSMMPTRPRTQKNNIEFFSTVLRSESSQLQQWRWNFEAMAWGMSCPTSHSVSYKSLSPWMLRLMLIQKGKGMGGGSTNSALWYNMSTKLVKGFEKVPPLFDSGGVPTVVWLTHSA